MAMGKPVICNSGVGDTDHVIKEYASGILVGDFTDALFDKVITEAIEVNQFVPEQIRAGASQFFSLEEGVRRYEGVYKKLIND